MSDIKDLHVGDKVQLNSGGPVMTVIEIRGDINDVTNPPMFDCAWFQIDSFSDVLLGAYEPIYAGNTLQDTFPAAALTKVLASKA